MISSQIDLARARLAWASEHIKKFDVFCREYFDTTPPRITGTVKPEGETKQVSFSVQLQPFPDKIGFSFCDAIHNMRALCDQLVTALGLHEGVPGAEKLAMPVCIADVLKPGLEPNQTFAHFSKKWKKLSPNALNTIEAIQPYKPHPTPAGDLVGTDHPLYVLNFLWNEDKHRIPLEIDAHVQQSIHLGADGPTTVCGNILFRSTGIEDGEPFFEVSIPIDESEHNIKPCTTFNVVLRKRGNMPTIKAIDVLVYLHNFVAIEVIDRFEPLF